MIAESGQRDQRELAAFHLDRGRRFFEQGNDADAIAELRRALYLSPYEAEAHLLLGRIYLRTGQTQAAIDAFKISLWSSGVGRRASRAGAGLRAGQGMSPAPAPKRSARWPLRPTPRKRKPCSRS